LVSELIERAGLEGFDPRMLEEALRRACEAPVNRGVDPATVLRRILAEARRGSRDMYSLVAAAKSVAEAA
jgi:hypothetical protein